MKEKHTITISLTFEPMTERAADIWTDVLMWISKLLPSFKMAGYLIEDEEDEILLLPVGLDVIKAREWLEEQTYPDPDMKIELGPPPEEADYLFFRFPPAGSNWKDGHWELDGDRALWVWDDEGAPDIRDQMHDPLNDLSKMLKPGQVALFNPPADFWEDFGADDGED